MIEKIKLILTFLKYDFVQYALIVGILIALCASLLGVILVLKRYSYIGDGLSHVAFGSMAVAAVLNISNNLYFIMPVTIVVAILILGLGRDSKIKGDAAIAMISVSTLAFGYLILNVFSKSANISGDVCTSLFGSTSILTLQSSDVWLCIIMSIIVLTVFILFYHKIFAITFDDNYAQAIGMPARLYNIIIAVIIAVVISLSMRLVGSLLISALIIFPALSAMRIYKNFKSVIICSALIAIVCALLGMLVSIAFGTPVGSTIVMANVVIFALFSTFGIIVRRT